MRNRKPRIGSPTAWLGILSGLAACLPAEAAESPAPIYWKQTVFSIPYQINRPATADDAPLEVRLLVSEDGGAQWTTLQSAEPRLRGFVYNAEKDGNYWFAVQTVDRFGRLHPPSEIRAELHVVVDTSPPRLEIDKEMTPAGEILLKLRLDDPNLQADSLSVNVRPQTGEFQPLDVPDTRAEPGAPLEQSITFAPPPGTRLVQVRAEATDLAGNRSISQIEIDLLTAQHREVTASPLSSPNTSPNSPPGPIGQSPLQNAAAQSPATPSAAAQWSPAGATSYPKTPFDNTPDPKNLLLDAPQLAGAARSPASGATAQPWPVDQVTAVPPSASQREPAGSRSGPTGASGNLAQSEPLPPPNDAARPAWSTRQASSPLFDASNAQGFAPIESADAPTGALELSAAQVPAAQTQSAPEEIAAGERLPSAGLSPVGSPAAYPSTSAPLVNAAWPGASPVPASPEGAASDPDPSAGGWQMVNSRTIALDYEVASVGPWGVSEVELWGTRDGGQTWRKYATDDDNRSPVLATVEGEGDYGFRVVVHSAGGFAAAPPQAGDAPEALVRVDLVAPEATIESVQQGTGNAADQILIRWSAGDNRLAANPVTLYYSAQAAGPWTIVAAGLANTGSYAWRAERHLPDELYVRLEVRDAAGNTTTFQTAQPVAVHRPRPQARIREVRPLGSSAIRPRTNAQR